MKRIHCNVNEPNKTTCLYHSSEDLEKLKINGVLYFPAIGLIANIIFGLVNGIFYISVALHLLKRTGVLYLYSLGAIFILLVSYLSTLIAAWFFFRLSRWTRKAMITYYLLMLALAIYLVIFPVCYFGQNMSCGDIIMLLISIISIVIWIPYFILSKRIDKVFCK